jgi:hypothetical protein
MSESVQRDDQWSSYHDMVFFRYDEHRPALHAEELKSENKKNNLNEIIIFLYVMLIGRLSLLT